VQALLVMRAACRISTEIMHRPRHTPVAGAETVRAALGDACDPRSPIAAFDEPWHQQG